MAHTESLPSATERVPALRVLPQPVPRATPACSHCGEPVAEDRLDAASETQFCCDGCRIVFAMLEQHGLDGYYQHGAAQPALATGRDYAEFDDPSFLALYAKKSGDEQTLDLLLEGVHCAACVWLVEKLPELVPGVSECQM